MLGTFRLGVVYFPGRGKKPCIIFQVPVVPDLICPEEVNRWEEHPTLFVCGQLRSCGPVRENPCTSPAVDCPSLSGLFVNLFLCNHQNPKAAARPHHSSICHIVYYNTRKSKAAPEGVVFLPPFSALFPDLCLPNQESNR